MSGRAQPRAGELRAITTVDGARLEYEVLGDGPPLVMLHGVLAGRPAFSRQRNAFAESHRLVMVSARGHDGSDNLLPEDYGAGTSDVEDLCGVLAAEGLDRVSLFAHSSGGATAFMFARRFPDRVSRMVLLEPTLFNLLPEPDRTEQDRLNNAIITAAETGGPEAGLRAFIEFAAGEAWRRLDTQTQAARLAALASCAALVGPHMRGLVDLNVSADDVRSLLVPALLMYGAESFPFEAKIADRFRALRPDLRVITVPGAAHNVHRDQADLVNAETLAFLSAA